MASVPRLSFCGGRSLDSASCRSAARAPCCATICAAAAFAGLQAPSLCTGHKKRSREAGAAVDRSDRNDVFEVEGIVDRRILVKRVPYLCALCLCGGERGGGSPTEGAPPRRSASLIRLASTLSRPVYMGDG